jgi:NAD(P)-dependent dehydrogenase (short-subunit alcohol dehydrogenase family)
VSSEDVVLISGGAAGIGRTIAAGFLEGGARVHVIDRSVEHVDEFLAAYPTASATSADISKPEEVESVFADLVDNYGRLSVLINNAGVAGPTAALEDTPIDAWSQCIDVDLNGLFYVTRLAVPLLKKNGGGSIINIASTAALHGYPLRSAYAASKWAQVGLTKTWAMELGPHGIRVNAISPGSVEGPRIDAVTQRLGPGLHLGDRRVAFCGARGAGPAQPGPSGSTVANRITGSRMSPWPANASGVAST